jgi:hypothetical protein
MGIDVGDIIIIIEDGNILGDGANIAVLRALPKCRGVRAGARPPRSPRAHHGASSRAALSARVSPLPLPDKPSLAVLPFEYMAGDCEQEHSVLDMVEGITTAIARLPWLCTIARNSAFTYNGKAIDLEVLELNVTSLRLATRLNAYNGFAQGAYKRIDKTRAQQN